MAAPALPLCSKEIRPGTAQVTNQERSFAQKNCVAGVPCATKSLDPSHHMTPLYDVIL